MVREWVVIVMVCGFEKLIELHQIDTAQHFDFTLVTDDTVFDKLINELSSLIDFSTYKAIEKDKIRHALRLVILNLYRNWLIDKATYTAFSRGNCKVPKHNSRYNPGGIIFKWYKFVIDELERQNMVIVKPGFYDTSTGEGRLSRMKPMTSMMTLFIKYSVKLKCIKKHKDTTVMRFRRDDKDCNNRNIFINDYPFDDFLTNRDCFLKTRYNPLLNSKIITINNIELGEQLLYCKIIIDKDGNYNSGCRFYGGDWQVVDSESRPSITIDLENTSELDYSGFHLRMLYHKTGLEFNDDPYYVPEIDDIVNIEGHDHRDLVKALLLRVINCKAKISGKIPYKAIQNCLKEYGYKEKCTNNLIDSIMEAIRTRHEPIAKYFFTGIGIHLQYEDSILTQNILEYFTTKNILVMPIHDSYVIATQHENELRQVMIEQYRSIYGYSPQITTKFHNGEKYEQNELYKTSLPIQKYLPIECRQESP